MYKVTVYLLYDTGDWWTKTFTYLDEQIDQGYIEDWMLDKIDNDLEKDGTNLRLTDWIIKGWTYEESYLQVVK